MIEKIQRIRVSGINFGIGYGVKTRIRKRGSARQVPIEIGYKQGKILVICWLLILKAARKRSGRNMAFKFSSELADAFKGKGATIRKKYEIRRMAEANRAFVHFR